MAFKYGLGCIPSPDYDKIIDVKEVIPKLKHIIDLPKEVDHTPNMTPVKDQGTEGTCVGFGVSVCKEYFDKKEYNKDIILSSRYIYEEARKIDGLSDIGDGTTTSAGLRILEYQGVCEESFWPYIANNRGTPNDGYDENAKKYRIQSFARISSYMDVFNILATHGPCLFSVPVFKNWKEARFTGMIPQPPQSADEDPGWHCICVVGYNDGPRVWKFQNSWDNWGDKGFGYLPYEYFNNPMGIECYTLVDIVG